MTPQERIESHIIGPMDDDLCWETDYYCSPKGYPRIHVGGKNGKTYLIHRLAWEIANAEPIPPGMVVRHTCDNPRCCNPAHLILGTDKDNTDDMLTRNRYSPNAVGYRRLPSGRYQARIRHNRLLITIGTYDTPEEAYAAYLAKREELCCACPT